MILAIKRAIEVVGVKASVAELDKGIYVAWGKAVSKLKGDNKNPFCKILMSYGIQPSVEFGEYQEQPACFINLTGKSSLTFPYPVHDNIRNIMDPWVDWDKTPSYFAKAKVPQINIVAGDSVDRAIKAVLKDEDIQNIIAAIRLENPGYGFTNGSCVTFAKLLRKVFAGEIWFLAVYDEDGWSFRHAFAKVKNQFYDGSGRTSESKILEKYGDPGSGENKLAPATEWGPQLDYLLKVNHDGFLDYHEVKLIQDILESSVKGATQRVTV